MTGSSRLGQERCASLSRPRPEHEWTMDPSYTRRPKSPNHTKMYDFGHFEGTNHIRGCSCLEPSVFRANKQEKTSRFGSILAAWAQQAPPLPGGRGLVHAQSA